MRILFDHGTPRGLARELLHHTVTTAKSMDWDRLSNGDLLAAAEEAGFELFLTTDQRIRYQQNLTTRKIAILVLSGSTKWLQVQSQLERIILAVDAAQPGTYTEVFIPLPAKRTYNH
jgi:hypothetical protein